MIALATDYLRGLWKAAIDGWNQFWFSPTAPHTLAIMRIATGLMIFYTHLVWSLEFLNFFGPQARVTLEFTRLFHESRFAWSHFHWISQPWALITIHVLALVIFLMFALGLCTRVTSVLTFLLAVSYVHRVPGALFGLDQINVLLAMYLMLSDCGAVYSLDGWRRAGSRSAGRGAEPQPRVINNLATRLIQLHMCIVYLFAALGKLQGVSWWEGTAMWLALGNYEYQSLDMTWVAAWPLLINLTTHLTLVWELTYPVLIWPRWTRPIVLFFAIPVHLGIAFTMGMVTFGVIMLVGNLAFVSPKLTRLTVDGLWRRKSPDERQPSVGAV